MRLPNREELKSVGAMAGAALPVVGMIGITAWALNEEPDSKPRHLTAAQVAEERGTSVSQYPAEAEGLDGPHRFCIEIGGRVLSVSTEKEAVRCEAGGQTVDIPAADSNPDNDAPMEEACAAADGTVEGVAVDLSGSFSVPACITAIEG